MLRIIAGLLLFISFGELSCAMAAQSRPLRVCAEPDNLPFSNQRQEGFENKIVELIARGLGRTTQYVWLTPDTGAQRELLAGRCDLIGSVRADAVALATTRPYYHSGYMFVTRSARRLSLSTLDDPRLRQLTLGVLTPWFHEGTESFARELTGYGLHTRNRAGFTSTLIAHPASQTSIIDAVIRGRLDAAIVWGPIANYRARQSAASLELSSLIPPDSSSLFGSVGVAMGAAPRDVKLTTAIQDALDGHRAEIDAILERYGVPRQWGPAGRIRNAQILRPPH